jgi:hypothetical protein
MRTTIGLILLVAAGCASAPSEQAPATAAPVVKAESAPAPVPATSVAKAESAQAAQTSQTAQAQTQAAKPAKGGGGVANKDGKVCRTESITNTRLKTRKVCLTPEEWQARSDTAQDAFRETAKSPMHPRLDSGG